MFLTNTVGKVWTRGGRVPGANVDHWGGDAWWLILPFWGNCVSVDIRSTSNSESQEKSLSIITSGFFLVFYALAIN